MSLKKAEEEAGRALQRYLVRKRSAYLTGGGGGGGQGAPLTRPSGGIAVKRFNSHPGMHFCPLHSAMAAAAGPAIGRRRAVEWPPPGSIQAAEIVGGQSTETMAETQLRTR